MFKLLSLVFILNYIRVMHIFKKKLNMDASLIGGIKVIKVIFFLVTQRLMKPIIAKKLR